MLSAPEVMQLHLRRMIATGMTEHQALELLERALRQMADAVVSMHQWVPPPKREP